MTEKRYVEELWAYDDIMVKDNESGEELWNNMIYERMNKQDERIKELEREKKSFMDDAIKFEKECKRLYNNLRLTDSDLYSEKLMYDKCKKENEKLKDFIRKISTNNEIILANGTIYKIDKVIK